MIFLYDGNETNLTYNGFPLRETIKAIVKEQLNGDYVLNLTYPVTDSEIFKRLAVDKLVRVPMPNNKTQFFRLKKPVRRNDVVEIFAEHLSADLMRRIVNPVSVQGSGQSAMNEVFSKLRSGRGNFYYDSDITKSHIFNTEEADTFYNVLLDGKHSVLGTWEGELLRDNFYISMRQTIGEDRGVLLSDQTNMIDFEMEENSENVVTRIHLKSTFRKENAEEDTVLTLSLDSPLINQYPYINEREYQNNDIKTIKELRRWGEAKFKHEKIDQISSKIKVSAAIVDGKPIHLGDVVKVRSKTHDITAMKKVVEYEWDALSKQYVSFIFDDAASYTAPSSSPIVETFDKLFEKQKSIEDEYDKIVEEQERNFEKMFNHKKDEFSKELESGLEKAKADADVFKAELENNITDKITQATAPFQNQINQLTTTVSDDIKNGLNGIHKDLNGMRLAYSSPFREDNNLIPNFAKFNDVEWFDKNHFTFEYIEDATAIGGYTLKVTCIKDLSSGGANVRMTPIFRQPENLNKKYTISYEIKANEESDRYYIGFEVGNRPTINVTTNWQRVETTFVNNWGGGMYDRFALFKKPKDGWAYRVGDIVYIRDFKLEEGEQATPITVGIGAYLNLDNNGFVTKAGKVIDGNTIASMLTVQPDAVRAVTEKMVLMGPIDNLVDMNGRNGIISDKRDLYVTDWFTDKLSNGDEFIFEADVTRLNRNGNYDLNTLIHIIFEDGSQTWFHPNLATKNIELNKKIASKTGLRVQFDKKVARYRFGFQQDAWDNFDKWKIDNLVIRRKKSADLIVDGAITTRHLATETFEGGQAKLGIIESKHIQTDAVEARHVKIDQALINKLSVGDALINNLIAKQAFINRLNAITIDASKVTGGELSANVRLKIGGTGYMRPYGQAVQFVIPEWSGAGHGVGMHFKGSHGGVGKGLTIYNLNNVSSPENPSLNYNETLLTVHGGIQGGFVMKDNSNNRYQSHKGQAVMSNTNVDWPLKTVGFSGSAQFHPISWISILNHNGNLSLVFTNGHSYYKVNAAVVGF